MVARVIEERCLDCHDGEEKKGGVDLSLLLRGGKVLGGSGFEELWGRVERVVMKGEMPPKEKKGLAEEERGAMVGWYRGEYVLRGGEEVVEGTRMRRLTRVELENSLEEVLGVNLRVAYVRSAEMRGMLRSTIEQMYPEELAGESGFRNDAEQLYRVKVPVLKFLKSVDFGLRMFEQSEEARVKREQHSRSILDYVREEARGMDRVVGVADRRKIDEYFTAVRELEVRLERFSKGAASPQDLGMARPEGPPERYEEQLRILADMLVLAFLTDTTRVSTFVFANEGSNKSYSFIGVPEGHHDLSHHGQDATKQAKIQRINRFHIEQLAYLLEKLDRTREGDGSLLDRCMIVYGSGIGDGNRHNHDDLPILVAGGGGGVLKPGRHVVHEKNTPLTNLYLGMLDGLGCPAPKLGDSTGRLTEI